MSEKHIRRPLKSNLKSPKKIDLFGIGLIRSFSRFVVSLLLLFKAPSTTRFVVSNLVNLQ